MTLVELKRIFEEWRVRLNRARDVLQPPSWSEDDWRHFARALSLLVKKYGATWDTEGITYWDIRWDLKEGGELICQVEENANTELRSLVVSQAGGFAGESEHYTWFYAEFGQGWEFVGEPYWVDGNWKEALAMILLPHQMAAGFYLNNSTIPVPTLYLAENSSQAA